MTTDNEAIPATVATPVMSESRTQISQVNPLLERARIPGETFRLPSCGMFYSDGELADEVENGEVHVYPMTAIDEIILASPSKLFSGEGVIEILGKCVPSVLRPKQLLAQDVDFLLLCMRKVSYGPAFDFDRQHFNCSAHDKDEEGMPLPTHPYQIDVGKIIQQTKEFDPTSIVSEYSLNMNNDQMVKLEPMRFGSYVSVMQILSQRPDESDMSEEDQKNLILDQLSSMINSVDEITDKKMIREWLEIITPDQVRKLNSAIGNMGTWGIDAKSTVKCRDCKEEMEVEIPTNPLVLFS